MVKFLVVTLLLVLAPLHQAGSAYCSYHMYSVNQPLTQVSCSDGANGLMTKFGYNDLSKLFPYVTAWDQLAWNSPKCGTCVQVTWQSKSIYLTTIDQCGPPTPGNDAHFDISMEAFVELFGQEGIDKGTIIADWQVVASSFCTNRGTNSPPVTVVDTPTTAPPKVTTPLTQPTTPAPKPPTTVPVPPVPAPPVPAQPAPPKIVPVAESGTAIVYYGAYTAQQSTSTISCSDGLNGLIAKFGLKDISSVFPYVAAWSRISWNSPKCGACLLINNQGIQAYVSAIDGTGAPPANVDSKLVLSKAIFETLFGIDGTQKGSGTATWKVVDSTLCKLRPKTI